MARVFVKDSRNHHSTVEKLKKLKYNKLSALQSVLNESDERKIINMLEKAVSTVGPVIDYQHDGLAINNFKSRPDFTKAVQNMSSKCTVPISVDPIPTFDELMVILKNRFPEAD